MKMENQSKMQGDEWMMLSSFSQVSSGAGLHFGVPVLEAGYNYQQLKERGTRIPLKREESQKRLYKVNEGQRRTLFLLVTC